MLARPRLITLLVVLGAVVSGGVGAAAATTTPTTTTPPGTIAVPTANPFADRGMWIWQLSQTDGGNVAEIIATAERYGIGTVLIKSSDGTTPWGQFNPQLVTDLHEAGIKVCAWQFVYGNHPVNEARRGAAAVKDGADCLVIDAESAYQGRYVAASTFMTTLRKLIGPAFPVGLAGFPYVDYHLNFPYSVFLGPGGAQYNLPQMYWADIGVSVSTVFTHTYAWNDIFERPIYPLGQLFGKLSATAIAQFNTLATDFGATGVSWWDWQSATPAYFADIDTRTLPPYGFKLDRAAVTIAPGAVGDPVVWAQQHLVAAGYRLAIDGSFRAATRSAVEAFQGAHGLPVTGAVDAATWIALDKIRAVTVRWVHRRSGDVAVIAARTVAHAGDGVTEPVPAWVGSTRDRNELHGDPGAGRPPVSPPARRAGPDSGSYRRGRRSPRARTSTARRTPPRPRGRQTRPPPPRDR